MNYMAKLFLSLLLHLFFISGGMIMADGEEEKTWCVAKPSASDAELVANKDFCCSNGVNCSVIDTGGACFNPNTLINHASVVMNSYYQDMGRNKWNCDFRKSGLITMSDPSYDNCHYK